MILYENLDSAIRSDAKEYFSSMDRRYGTVTHLFAHDRQNEVLAEIIDRKIDLSRPVRIFDLGCGQGQLLARAYEIVAETAPEIVSKSRFVGLDASEVAIAQCEQRYPQLEWILDTFQEFADNAKNRSEYFGTFDLVINRGGLVVVNSISELEPMLRRIADLLRSGGYYFSSEGIAHYQVWINRVYRSVFTGGGGPEHAAPIDRLGLDPFDLAELLFDETRRIPDDGFYLNVYRKNGAGPKHGRPAEKPLLIDFELSSGQPCPTFISGDELSYQRLGAVVWPVDGGKPFRSPVPHQYPEAAAKVHSSYTDKAASLFSRGRATVVLPGMRLRSKDGWAVDVTDAAIELLARTLNIAYFPRYLLTIRDCVRRLSEMMAADPAILMLGAGLEDHAINDANGQPRVDLFEFCNAMDWLLYRAVREEGRSVLWLSSRPAGQRSSRQEGWSYNPDVTLQFARAEAAMCARYGVPCVQFGDGDDLNELKGVALAALQSAMDRYGTLLARKPEVAPPLGERDPRYPVVTGARVGFRSGKLARLPEIVARSVYLASNHDMEDKEADGIDGGHEYARVQQQRIIDWLYAHRKEGLQRLMIIGDSVRMRRDDVTGYILPAYERLVGRFNITHIAHNSQGTRAVLRWLPEWLNFGRPEVVHINAGLHDLMYEPETHSGPAFTDVQTYADNLEAIVALLRQHGVKRIVWASSTPVSERWHNAWHENGVPRRGALRFIRKNDDIRRYNAAAEAVMRRHGIEINDLFAVVEHRGVETCVRGDGVHLNPIGSRLVADSVAACLLSSNATKRTSGPIWSDWQD